MPSFSEVEESEGEEERRDGGEERQGGDTQPSEPEQDAGVSLKAKVSLIAKQLLYFLSEMEQFKPPSQKLKYVLPATGILCIIIH